MTLPDPNETESSMWALLGAATAVFLAQLLLDAPPMRHWVLWPDAVEYLLIGNSWASGTGFVDPVQWFTIPDAGQVVPAFAVRAPLVPFGIGIALRMGATVLTVIQLYAVWCAMALAVLTFGASRMMRLPAAAAAALCVGTFPAWRTLSHLPMTETTAVAMVALVAFSLRFASRSVGGAVLCAILTLIGWLARPNLAGMALAVFVAMMITAPTRPTLRNRPAWAYLATFGIGFVLIRELTIYWTGFAPYSGYAILGLFIKRGAANLFSSEPASGFFELVLMRPIEVLSAATGNLQALGHEAFIGRRFAHAGWIAVPGVLWCLWGGRTQHLERRFMAFCAIGFTIVAALTLAYRDPNRYPLLSVVAGGLCGVALLDDLCVFAARRIRTDAAARAMRLVPLVLALVLVGRIGTRPAFIQQTFGWPLRDLQEVEPRLTGLDISTRELCPLIPRNAFITGHNPWGMSFWCGNPAIKAPRDFNLPDVRRDFLSLRRPVYFVQKVGERVRPGKGRTRLERIAETPKLNLYRVVGIPTSEEWTAPPPVGCAGRPATCLAEVNR